VQKRERAAAAAAKRKETQDRRKFSKVAFIVTLFSQFTRALTCQNFRRGRPKPQSALGTEEDVEEEVANRPGS